MIFVHSNCFNQNSLFNSNFNVINTNEIWGSSQSNRIYRKLRWVTYLSWISSILNLSRLSCLLLASLYVFGNYVCDIWSWVVYVNIFGNFTQFAFTCLGFDASVHLQEASTGMNIPYSWFIYLPFK